MTNAKTNRLHRALASAAAWSLLAAAAPPARGAGPNDAALCEREMLKASKAYDVPVDVLYAVGLTETGRKGWLRPYAVNADGRAFEAANLHDAVAIVHAEQARGAKFIDVGCMQIDIRWHGDRFPSVEAMFDPTANVEYASRFLKGLKEREGAWTLAVARYNAGPDRPDAQRAYVCAVIRNLVASGLGGWTPSARALCG